jgi:hypothetical protein
MASCLARHAAASRSRSARCYLVGSILAAEATALAEELGELKRKAWETEDKLASLIDAANPDKGWASASACAAACCSAASTLRGLKLGTAPGRRNGLTVVRSSGRGGRYVHTASASSTAEAARQGFDRQLERVQAEAEAAARRRAAAGS